MKDKLKELNDRIKEAAVSCGRDPETVTLVAVSKTMSAEKVRQAIDAGVAVLGENYIQEAREKVAELAVYQVSWHFIGHLQSNKSKYAVKLFDLIHTVDSIKLAGTLDKEAGKINKVQDILVQVNTGMEASKFGVSPDGATDLVRAVSGFKNLHVRGLMTIPPLYNDPENVAPYFRALRELRDSIEEERIPNVSMDGLSMGMTGDFEVAIKEGATIVRVGTAIFGERY